MDHNEGFARVLPRTGTITREIVAKDGNSWYLLEIEAPFEYEGSIKDQLVIRSRWKDHDIAEEDPTSVFVLLVPDASVIESESTSIEDFELVAWGMSYTE